MNDAEAVFVILILPIIILITLLHTLSHMCNCSCRNKNVEVKSTQPEDHEASTTSDHEVSSVV